MPSLNHQKNSQGYRIFLHFKEVGNFGGTESESDSYGGKSPFCGNFSVGQLSVIRLVLEVLHCEILRYDLGWCLFNILQLFR